MTFFLCAQSRGVNSPCSGDLRTFNCHQPALSCTPSQTFPSLSHRHRGFLGSPHISVLSFCPVHPDLNPFFLSHSILNSKVWGTVMLVLGLPGGTGAKEPAWQCKRQRRLGLDSWAGKNLWRREWQPTPVFLPEESHGQRSLAGYWPLVRTESDMAEVL